MRRVTKVAIVLTGYGIAFAAAVVATAIRIELTKNAPDADASSGMYAGGDMLLFLAVFGAVALVPTSTALVLLRGWPRFGTWLGRAALGVACSAVGAWLAFVQPFGREDPGGWLSLAAVLSVFRLLGSPLIACGLAVAALIAPSRASRRAVMVAFAVEALLCLYGGFHFLVAPNL